MIITGWIVLVICCILGIGGVLLGLPGLFLICGGYLGYGLLSGNMAWSFFFILLFVAAVGEVSDWVVSIVGAKKYGTSRNGIIGAIVGGILGAIIGAPVFLVGSVLGMLAGAFSGAFIFEYYSSRNREAALKSAIGALLGKITAIATKLILSIIAVTAIIIKLT